MMKHLSLLLNILFVSVLILVLALPFFSHITILRLLVRPILLISLMGFISVFFVKTVVRNPKLKQSLQSFYLILYSFSILFILTELVFNFLPRSHNWNGSLQSMNWMTYYFKMNEQGFRDTDYDQKDTTKKKLFFVGDSFTAGHGIDDPKNRYSDILGEKLSEEYEFFNLGSLGADTKAEFQILKNHAEKPELMVYQYYGNDIDKLAIGQGSSPATHTPFKGCNLLTKVFARGSYIGNYAFWKFPPSNQSGYIDSLFSYYQDTTLLDLHFQDLQKIVDYTETHDINTLVIIFPFLFDLEGSQVFIKPVKAYFEKQQIPVLDLSNAISLIPKEERFVNNNDLHPNEQVNAIVAKVIYDRLEMMK